MPHTMAAPRPEEGGWNCSQWVFVAENLECGGLKWPTRGGSGSNQESRYLLGTSNESNLIEDGR